MMQIEKVTITFKYKKNLGNYESADGSCMLTAFVEPSDDKDEVMKALWKMAKENVKAAIAPLTTKQTLEEFYLGLPIHIQESEAMRQVRELIIKETNDAD